MQEVCKTNGLLLQVHYRSSQLMMGEELQVPDCGEVIEDLQEIDLIEVLSFEAEDVAMLQVQDKAEAMQEPVKIDTSPLQEIWNYGNQVWKDWNEVLGSGVADELEAQQFEAELAILKSGPPTHPKEQAASFPDSLEITKFHGP